MSASRYQVQSEARRVFARHWVDLDRIHIGVYRDALRVTGELHSTNATNWDRSGSLIEVLQSELRRIREIRFVQLDFSNWTRDRDGLWVEKQIGLDHGDVATTTNDDPEPIDTTAEAGLPQETRHAP